MHKDLRTLENLKTIAKASENTTLGAICNVLVFDKDFEALEHLRDTYANLTWDTSIAEARDIIKNESS